MGMGTEAVRMQRLWRVGEQPAGDAHTEAVRERGEVTMENGHVESTG